MRRKGVWIAVTLFMLIGLPAYAYGDPTGGALFQVLLPILAAVWGMWLIFARKLRNGLGKIVRKLSGRPSQDPSSE